MADPYWRAVELLKIIEMIKEACRRSLKAKEEELRKLIEREKVLKKELEFLEKELQELKRRGYVK